MFMIVNGNYADADFYFLEQFIELLDVEILKIDSQIKSSADPDSEGLCDRGEYFIGHGFAAIQRYFLSTFPQFKIDRNNALDTPPKINTDITLMRAINAGANYWKHQEEWGLRGVVYRDKNNISGMGLATIETIEKITPWADYTLANLLAELLSDKTLCFKSLLPSVVEWRHNLVVMNT